MRDMPIAISHHHSLREHNTFGLEVKAKQFISYHTIDELVEVLASLRDKGEQILHIGGGSNLLFTKDFEGTILHSEIKFIEEISRDDKHIFFRVGSGVVWDDFCAQMARENYFGTENLSYIPGEVGASAIQNIGAYGMEVASIIHEVETFEVATGQPRVFRVQECEYGYRDSIFKNRLKGKYIVTAVVFRLSRIPVVHLDYGPMREFNSRGENLTAQAIRDAVIDIRRSKLPEPKEMGSAGSFFKNPVIPVEIYRTIAAAYTDVPHFVISEDEIKIPAAWLIEQCGWKGKRHRGAGVYEKQPLILVNLGHATANDIMELATLIQQSVFKKFHIQLEPEVNYI